jgi:hypothetical protein
MTVETIYMPLLDEGADVSARVQAQRLDDARFRVLDPTPSDQERAFAPGVIVDTSENTFSGGARGIVALAISN